MILFTMSVLMIVSYIYFYKSLDEQLNKNDELIRRINKSYHSIRIQVENGPDLQDFSSSLPKLNQDPHL